MCIAGPAGLGRARQLAAEIYRPVNWLGVCEVVLGNLGTQVSISLEPTCGENGSVAAAAASSTVMLILLMTAPRVKRRRNQPALSQWGTPCEAGPFNVNPFSPRISHTPCLVRQKKSCCSLGLLRSSSLALVGQEQLSARSASQRRVIRLANVR